ncbi:MAG: zf-TFIIB domain-containing protein [Candidatus Gastranaerophilales bacterium]|nr:zf-TFIIB domain-containing protein [Candidatus Gastranaerophilales bacterium]
MADSKEELICPACKGKMVKIYTKAGMNVDICLNGCGGIWFDNREIDTFSKDEVNYEELHKLYSDKEFNEVTIEKDRVCPVCSRKMVQHKVSEKSDVVIDECYTCGGKFLDYGEMESVKAAMSDDEKLKEIVNAIKPLNTSKHVDTNLVRKFLGSLYQNHIK